VIYCDLSWLHEGGGPPRLLAMSTRVMAMVDSIVGLSVDSLGDRLFGMCAHRETFRKPRSWWSLVFEHDICAGYLWWGIGWHDLSPPALWYCYSLQYGVVVLVILYRGTGPYMDEVLTRESHQLTSFIVIDVLLVIQNNYICWLLIKCELFDLICMCFFTFELDIYACLNLCVKFVFQWGLWFK